MAFPTDAFVMHALESIALDEAQALADLTGSPCAVWSRDGWAVACDQPPDEITPDPCTLGWQLDAIVDPMTQEA